MSSGDVHLTSDQIHALVDDLRSTSLEAQLDMGLERGREHLAACEACQKRLQMYRTVDERLIGLREGGQEIRGIKCPSEHVWLEIAAGLTTGKVGEKHIEHAAQCDYCGPLLRRSIDDLADGLTVDEQQVLEGLQSTTAEWQKGLVHKLTKAGSEVQLSQQRPERGKAKRRFLSMRRHWVYGSAALAAAAIVAVASWWYFQPRASRAQRLLAQAYTQQRTMELRISNAEYAALRMERGSERSRLSRPSALLEAEASIARGLSAAPHDPEWLAARGRAELLEWQYQAAINSFNRALKVQPDSPALLTDLATAYFQSGESQDRPVDYGKAIDLLGRVLAKNPDDPVALFNRAIADERMFLYDESLADWERFLRAEPNGQWSGEARQRRETLIQRMKARKRSDAFPIQDPSAAVQVLSSRAAPQGSAGDWPDSLDEAYLDVAVTQWLPILYPSRLAGEQKKSSPAIREALNLLANVLDRYHHDNWLRDVLRGNHSVSWKDGVRTLGIAVRANTEGDADTAMNLSSSAQKSFRVAGNPAGALRGRLEYVIALKRGQLGSQCLMAALRLLRELKNQPYPLIRGLVLLEVSTCYGLVGNAEMAQVFGRQAVRFARGTGYGDLQLRSLSYEDGVGVNAPRPVLPQAWSRVVAGLRRFWGSSYQPLSALEFYGDLNYLAEETELWHFAEGVSHEITLTASRSGDRAFESASHHWLAQVCQMAGDVERAEAEFDAASRFFASLPATPASRSNWAAMETYQASLEVQRGAFRSAAARLQRVQDVLPQITNSHVSGLYYESLGDLYLRQDEVQQAEKALNAAIKISEAGLANLSAELDRLSWEHEAGKAYRDLAELYFRGYRNPIRALEIWEWYRAAPLRARLRNARNGNIHFSILDADRALLNIPTQQKFLPTLWRETVVSFASFPTGLAIWAFDDRGIKATWVVLDSTKLNQVVQRFAERCADPTSDVALLKGDAHQLYEWLIAPVESKLDRTRRLVVEPDGTLSSVPFQALLDSHGYYLDQRFAVTVSPGMAYFRQLRASAYFSQHLRTMIVGEAALGSKESTDYPPLPDAEREIRQVATRFEKAAVLMGKEATLEAVERALPEAEVFHFAGHSVTGGTHPGLLLAPERSTEKDWQDPTILDATRLGREQVKHARLVVLSACETAGKDQGLVDPDSLVRAFLRGGVPHVVATRWRVSSNATTELIDNFYARILQGASVADALRGAAEDLRTRSETSHPYYWAAFGAYGR